MQYQAANAEDYIQQIPEERRASFSKLREVIKTNLPAGFSESMGYGMIGFGVPHSLYPAGYHCDPKQPLPFIGIASQKNFVALYHMGIYADENLLNWFKEEYAKVSTLKLDMGKSCIRFKKPDQIPFDLIGKLATKMTAEDWIERYELNYKRK